MKLNDTYETMKNKFKVKGDNQRNFSFEKTFLKSSTSKLINIPSIEKNNNKFLKENQKIHQKNNNLSFDIKINKTFDFNISHEKSISPNNKKNNLGNLKISHENNISIINDNKTKCLIELELSKDKKYDSNSNKKLIQEKTLTIYKQTIQNSYSNCDVLKNKESLINDNNINKTEGIEDLHFLFVKISLRSKKLIKNIELVEDTAIINFKTVVAFDETDYE